MNVDAIKNGVVIDHIKAGQAMKLYNLLELDKLECTVAIIAALGIAEGALKPTVRCKAQLSDRKHVLCLCEEEAVRGVGRKDTYIAPFAGDIAVENRKNAFSGGNVADLKAVRLFQSGYELLRIVDLLAGENLAKNFALLVFFGTSQTVHLPIFGKSAKLYFILSIARAKVFVNSVFDFYKYFFA